MVKTRVAPSPTGDPHIGTAYTALFNYAFAKKSNGKFVLRIEDTDRTRFIKDSEARIIDSLKWLGLDWDEEIIHQSNRLSIYKEHVQILLDKKIAYEKDAAVWAKMPGNRTFSWEDLVGNKKISFEGKERRRDIAA